MRRALAAVTLMVAATSPGIANAQPGAPQVGALCPELAKGALTKVGETALECVAGQWTLFDGAYPSSEIWLSYGPALRLHGQGMRNPEMLSGLWRGRPLSSDGACRAAQSAVVSAGEVGPTQESNGQPGAILDFEVLPVMFTIDLSGDCVWHKQGW